MSQSVSVKRVEDLRFLRGEGEFVDDLKLQNMSYLGLVRSPYAHAKILKIDFSKARQNPDFIDCITGEEINEITNPITTIPGMKETKRKQLAIGKTRFVGEPVAAFVSKTRYSLEDIAESVDVEYEELAPVLNIETSKEGGILVFEDWNDNLFYQNSVKKGNTDDAIAASKNVIRARVTTKRQAGVPIEPRSYVAKYNKENDSFEVIASAQRAHAYQNYLSSELKIPPNKFHVLVKDVGGGFGTKGAQSYCEPLLACIFAKRTGLAVNATTTRTEDFLETASGRDETCEVELACDSDGKITALKANIEADVGVSGTLSISPRNTILLFPEVYKIPNISLKGSCYLTNKVPHGPVRGAGRPEADYFMERAMDVMARHLKMDPLEFRKKNLIQPDELPFDNGAGAVYDSGNFPLLLQKIEPPIEEMRKWRDECNKKGTRYLSGVGLCIEIEDTGVQLKESAKLSITRDGRVILTTGSTPHGQGLETSLAQICAKELGVPLDKVKVEYGDTKTIPFSIGTFGSRSISVGGSAALEVAKRAREEIVSRIQKLSGARSEDISLENGNIISFERDSREGARATVLMSLSALIEKMGGIEVYTEFTLKGIPYASGAHACALTLDRESGKIKILRYVVVDDCGVEINPMIVDGQLHGGVVHGLGGSILEEIVYSDTGQLLTTNFIDYMIPSSMDTPEQIELHHVETPSPLTLNGAKGVGESGTIAAYPCIFNALNDALAEGGFRETQLNSAPVSPEDVVKVLSSKQDER